MRAVLCLLLAACTTTEPVPTEVPEETAPEEAPAPEVTEAAQPEEAPAWSPTEAEQRVVDALSVRDPEPHCDDVEAMVDDPVATLRAVVAHVEMPPWAPMRAATCLIGNHPREAEDDALRWVADPDKRGLTTLVLARLDGLPLDTATRIGEAALHGPHADLARQRMSRLRTPELRALATP